MAIFKIRCFVKAIQTGNCTNNPMTRFLVPNSSPCFNYHSKSSEYPILDVIKGFGDMIRTRPLPPVEDFNILLHDLLLVTPEKTSFSSTLVLKLFRIMSAVGVLINTSTAHILIKCNGQLQHTNLSFSVLGFFFKQGIVCNNVSIYNTILDGFISEDKTQEAERLFKNMFIMNNNNNDDKSDQLLLCEPDIVTYNTMLKGLCKVGDNFTAIALLRIMDGRGGCCKLDIVSCNTVIDGLCSNPGVVNTIHDAIKLCNDMVFRKGIHPDANTYNSLIYAFSKLGRWDEVCKMVKRKEDENVSLDLKIFNIIVHALCKQGFVLEDE
ncbi:pentatricopeptide repeat-containing protein At3g49170, chloroplastic-like [Rutidosis leptorrhynchoides]|uniref:pentatricopeptide repeat-containing protein At3g49170, chloroplastic-like n=1 Tax=Rutidosis leptorrhynchoides TaxID=125765 RepID=UPI003A99EF31